MSRFGRFLSSTRLLRLKHYGNNAKRLNHSSPVVTEKLGSVFLIGINRPEQRNCVNLETANLLVQAVKTFEADEEATVGVLYGKGGCFCAGMDLKEVSGMKSVDILPTPPDPRGPMGPTRWQPSKPMIAAIDGYAVAGGLELALLCDLRVVEETAIMGVFCRRFGVPLIDGGTIRLPHLIGLSRALDLILTGRPIDAKEAFEFGLANRVVKCGTALGQAVNLARSLEKFPQKCLRADRTSAYYAMFEAKSLPDAFRFEYENAVPVLTQESIAGATKFKDGVGRYGSFHLMPDDELKAR